MDSQELNRACELAFLVAREGVEQDPPIDPPASMRMFLYVRQFPQRALTVARQVLADDHEFRSRVATAATIDNVGEVGLAWLQGDGSLPGDAEDQHGQRESADTPAAEAIDSEGPVTKETIRTEMDELKNLVGQLSKERAAVDSEVEELASRLEESEESSGLSRALSAAVASDAGVRGSASLTAQIRSLHADLKQARSDRDQAQEAKELAILEHAELAEELENLRDLASTAKVQLAELEAKVRDVSTEKDQLASEKERLSAERETLASDKDSLAADVAAAEARLAESEEKLNSATANLESLTAELEDIRSNAGASVEELQTAVAARAAMESHVDALGGAHAKARAEMERVNAALSDKNASDAQKIETLKVALSSVTAERDALQAKLETVRATVSSLQGEMAKLDSNFSDAESVATVLSERMDELQSSVDALPAESDIEIDFGEFETPEAPDLDALAPVALVGSQLDVESTDSGADEPADVVTDDLAEDVESAVEVDAVEVEELPIEEPQPEEDSSSALSSDPSTGEVEPEPAAWDSEPLAEEVESNELIPDEIFVPEAVGDAEYQDPEVMEPGPEISPLVMSETAEEFTAEEFTAGLLDEVPEQADVPASEMPETEDIDEVHALVAETVASFEPSETDDLPGSAVSATDAAEAGASSDRGGLTSLFTSFIPGGSDPESAGPEDSDSHSDGGSGVGLLAAAGVGTGGFVAGHLAATDEVETMTDSMASDPGLLEAEPETAVEDEESVESPGVSSSTRGPIVVPEESASDPLESARYILNTENVVLLIDGDPVAAMGWPSVDRVEQRRNLVHYLSVMAGTSGAAPDVLLDRDFGVDRLPDSRSVRVRVTNEGGSVSSQIVSLIDSYPNEWPVVVVTDNMDLSAEAAMKGATLLNNGQLLDLFISP